MEYREHEPPTALRPFVRLAWTMRAGGGGGRERVVPDGCPEIILNRGAAFRRWEGSAFRSQGEAMVVGQLRSAIFIEPGGEVDLIGIRFEPAGLFALTGVPAPALVDSDAGLDQVDRPLRAGLLSALLAEHERAIVRRIWSVLARRYDERGALGDGCGWVASEAASRLRRGGSDVSGVARAMRVHERTIERAFRDEVGIGPKLAARIFRLSRVVAEIGREEPLGEGGWAGVALRHGFSDQSHLIRDFRLIAGTTPG
ncbi:MAG: hypothetical protein CMJ31_01350, partial [Phycisphaerae bacterium]|nr:hypothetical protein [Phycisphaerae bacterium]